MKKMTENIISTNNGLVFNIKKGIRLMTARERRLSLLIATASLVNGALQTLTIVAIVPIIHILMDPSVDFEIKFLPKNFSDYTIVENKSILLIMAFMVFFLILIKGLFSWYQIGWMSRFSAGCEMRLNAFLMDRMLTAPYSWLIRQNSARLRQLIFGFVANWSRDFIRTLMKIMNDIFFVIIISVVLIWANPLIGLIGLIAILLLGFGIFFAIKPKILLFAESKRKAIFGANEVSTAAVLGIKDVKMSAAEEYFSSKFKNYVNQYANADAKAQQWNQLPKHLIEFTIFSLLITMCIVVVLSETRDAQLASVLLLYGLAMIRLMPIFSTLVQGFTTLVGSFPMISELEKLVESTQTPEMLIEGNQHKISWNLIRVNNITLSLPDSGRNIIDRISINITRGKSYGIVGPSGAGKSTFVDIIAGLLPPTSGEICLDEKILSPELLREWRKHFGYVAQRPYLLDASLVENIVFNSKQYDETKLTNVIQLACLENVVKRLPDGIHTRLGEMGVFLSGGERQRVAIARALYRGADILILDEATNSLDPIMERDVAESIHALKGKVTTLIISHKLPLVKSCDEIWVFDNSKLTAYGTHNTLLNNSELYTRMSINGI